MMEETGAEEIEMRRTEDGLGFNIRGGRDSEYVQFRVDSHQFDWLIYIVTVINQSKGR